MRRKTSQHAGTRAKTSKGKRKKRKKQSGRGAVPTIWLHPSRFLFSLAIKLNQASKSRPISWRTTRSKQTRWQVLSLKANLLLQWLIGTPISPWRSNPTLLKPKCLRTSFLSTYFSLAKKSQSPPEHKDAISLMNSAKDADKRMKFMSMITSFGEMSQESCKTIPKCSKRLKSWVYSSSQES